MQEQFIVKLNKKHHEFIFSIAFRKRALNVVNRSHLNHAILQVQPTIKIRNKAFWDKMMSAKRDYKEVLTEAEYKM